MILSKEAILEKISKRIIHVNPFEPSLIQENSLDFRLGYDMWAMNTSDTPRDIYGDSSEAFERLPVSEGGFFTLEAGGFYIGTTFEEIGTVNPYDLTGVPNENPFIYSSKASIGMTDFLCPEVRARSSVGRWGLTVALCAGHGEIGYRGKWALEVRNVSNSPVILKPRTVIGQMVFHTCTPTHESYGGAGRYQTKDGEVIRFLPKPLKVL